MAKRKYDIYLNYLKQRLGFIEDGFEEAYFNQIFLSLGRFRYVKALSVEKYQNMYNRLLDSDEDKADELDNAYYKRGEYYYPYKFDIVDYLSSEISIKNSRNPSFKYLAITPYFSATDIAAYTFCPVSYAISKTFEQKRLESSEIGLRFHELGGIANFIPGRTKEQESNASVVNEQFENIRNKYNAFFFEDLRTSEILFGGHVQENKKKYFKSRKGKFVGQPDYILNSRNNEIYVIEEKYQPCGQNDEVSHENHKFYQNHINQLASYIYGIEDYEIQYGYLVYWKYSMSNNEPVIESCIVKKVERSPTVRNRIISVYKKLQEFQSTKKIEFNISERKAAKCANCVYTIYCGHKTGRFEVVTLPYSIGFLFTKNVRLPMVLESKRKKYDHYFIPIKADSSYLFHEQRIFFFQLGKNRSFEQLIEQNLEQIHDFEQVYNLSFVYHKYLVENIDELDEKSREYDFLYKVAQMTEKRFYDEVVRLTFTNQPIDSVCMVRKFDYKTLIVWGRHAFIDSRTNKLRFPYESLLPLEDIELGESCFVLDTASAKRG